MDIWDVTRDEERDRWDLVPLVSVGPLRFGSTHAEVVAALENAGRRAPATATVRSSPAAPLTEARFLDIGVSTYYMDGHLYCVAIDALRGPQVTLDGVSLVARVPSEIEQWMFDQAEVHGWQPFYGLAGDLELFELGLVARAQRAGDVVLTRPVIFAERADLTWEDVPLQECQWCPIARRAASAPSIWGGRMCCLVSGK